MTVKQLDLAYLRDIQASAEAIQASAPVIDFLILNAGVLSGPAKTREGFEMSIGTNHIGHFHLTKCLLPKLKDQVRAVGHELLMLRQGHTATGLASPSADLPPSWSALRLVPPIEQEPLPPMCIHPRAVLLEW